MFKIGKAPKATLPKFRVYVAEEEGALLVRHGRTVSNLVKALEIAASYATAIDWQIRSFYLGREQLVNVDRVISP